MWSQKRFNSTFESFFKPLAIWDICTLQTIAHMPRTLWYLDPILHFSIRRTRLVKTPETFCWFVSNLINIEIPTKFTVKNIYNPLKFRKQNFDSRCYYYASYQYLRAKNLLDLSSNLYFLLLFHLRL